MVFGESVALGIPVITTNTTSAIEMIANEGVGIVCENSEDGIYDAVKSVLSKNIGKISISLEQSEEINKKAKKHFLELIEINK